MPETKRTASGVLGGLLGLVGLSAVAGVLITATVTPAIALSGAAATSAITMFDNLPSVLDIDKLMLPTTLYAKNPETGEDVELAQFYDQNRSPVVFDEVTPVMYDAILSSEDPRFYQHGGVDLIGTSRALLQNAQGGGETQGGSSISQQYVKNILIQRCERDATTSEELLNCWTDATTAVGTEGIQRKLQEMRYAIALEQKYSKNDILLGYLNIANFGGQNYGVDAAAKYYFGVAAKDLTLAQAATLAGIVQNPNTYRIDQPANEVNGAADGYSSTKVRQTYVLGRMLEDGKITQEQHDAAVAEPITPVITPASTGCAAAGGAAYFCQYVKNIIKTDPAFGATEEDRIRTLQRGGLNVYTTLDYRVQVPADNAMKEFAPTSIEGMFDPSTGKFGSAAVSLEATTGRILSISQNTVFSEDAALAEDPNYSSLIYAADYKYGNSTGFEAGSTFKLFTLIDWLEQGHSVNERLDGRVRVIKRMTNSCNGDWVNVENARIGNFGGGGGYAGTVMQFTAESLNSGFFAMAEQLDLCDIQKVATKMGVMRGDGVPVTMDTQFSVIGSNNVAPMALAGAYATVANNGVYCQPKAIDRVTDADGNEIAPPQTTCSQVIDPKVAATAAFALQGVMSSGGTGAASNPEDGTPLIGKTGTHESYQTWMVESSTKVATAVWVGNSIGQGNIFDRYHDGIQMSQLRHEIAPRIQAAADAAYGGDRFPDADSNLTRQVYRDLPNVIGMSVDQATATLEQAGFDVSVGEAVDSAEAAGIVAAQSPGAGRVSGGTQVTINPSNGQGLAVPDVTGKQLNQAVSELRAAGFGNVQPGQCTEDATAGIQGKVSGTNPPAGTVVNRNAAITVAYNLIKCA